MEQEQGGEDRSCKRGYKKPEDVDCPTLDEELLHRLETNNGRDDDIVGLTIEGRELFWLEGAGRTIGENSRLRVLHIVLRDDVWGENAWLADLCRGLSRNRSIEWLSLEINECRIGWDVFFVLAPFLENNDNLRCITLQDYANPETLSSMVSALTKCKHLLLECIEVDCSRFVVDKTVAMFFEHLNNLPNLTDLAFDLRMGRTGCTALANLLNNPASNIINLRPTFSHIIDDECITIISNAWSKSSSLVSLEIVGNGNSGIEDRSVSSYGWGVVFDAVSQSESLQHLHIRTSVLLDCDFACLTSALSTNRSIKVLELEWVGTRSLRVRRKFAKWLGSPNAILTELSLRGCTINTKDKIAILMSLKVNKFITKLNFEWTGETKPGLWKVLSHLLCDKTSIDNTYMSNHSLHSLLVGNWSNGDDIPHDIASLLKTNEPKNKLKVARCKVLNVHFNGEVTANHPLARFPETILPHVLSWFGRDNLGFSAMFNAVQFFPSLFDCRTVASFARKKRRCM